MNPIATNAAPATINQCGYSIAESIAYFAFAFTGTGPRNQPARIVVTVDEKQRFLIEAKAINIELKDAHVKQAIDYAANEGITWVVLSNGAVWRLYCVLSSANRSTKF
jgi:hypothetical protein